MGGRRAGDPLCFLVALMLLAACGGSRGPGRPDPSGPTSFGRPTETYQQIGLIAGPTVFPAVASFSTMAGPTDSTYVLFGLSLPANALRFQRDDVGFAGEYRVTVTFSQDSQEVKRFERDEVVRVPSFAETSRTDESVVFQQIQAEEKTPKQALDDAQNRLQEMWNTYRR